LQGIDTESTFSIDKETQLGNDLTVGTLAVAWYVETPPAKIARSVMRAVGTAWTPLLAMGQVQSISESTLSLSDSVDGKPTEIPFKLTAETLREVDLKPGMVVSVEYVGDDIERIARVVTRILPVRFEVLK
jgi:hypothetical protein